MTGRFERALKSQRRSVARLGVKVAVVVPRTRQDERVTKDESGLMALLRRLDDSEWLEWPSEYSSSEAAASLRRLVSDLENALGTRCSVEGDGQSS